MSSHGGSAYETGWRRLVYVPQDQRVRLEIDARSRPRMRLHAETPFSAGLALYRVPRLLYAFLESFLPPERRLGHLPYVTFGTESISDLKQKPGFIPVVEQLSRFGFSVQANENGFTLWKSIHSEDLNEAAFQEMLRLADSLTAILSDSLEIPVQPLVSELHCAYCKERLESSDANYCSLCRTPHHRECFELNGKCSVFGCTASASSPQGDVDSLSLAGMR